MSVKVTIVENHTNKNIKHYNIDKMFIEENFGSINEFKSILNKKRSKEQQASLIAFLSEIRPLNEITDMRKITVQPLSTRFYIKLKLNKSFYFYVQKHGMISHK